MTDENRRLWDAAHKEADRIPLLHPSIQLQAGKAIAIAALIAAGWRPPKVEDETDG